MKDMITPDYSTLTQLTKSCYRTVYQPGDYTTATPLIRDMNEGGVNEGPFMTYHDGKYYLTYSRFGYGARDYDISMAVSDKPLGQFVKIPHGEGDPVTSNGSDPTNDFLAGNGHHNFAYTKNETIAFYHSHKNPIHNWDKEGRFLGKMYCLWIKSSTSDNARYGIDLMQGNGPTVSPQPLAEVNAKAGVMRCQQCGYYVQRHIWRTVFKRRYFHRSTVYRIYGSRIQRKSGNHRAHFR